MRLLVLSAALGLAVIGCKNEEAKGPATKPAAPSAAVPEPSPVKDSSRGPNSDKQDILGKWKSTGDEPVQFEFTSTELTIRKGEDSKDTKTVSYAIRNEIRPSEIDWGTGADAAYGLYTLDGKNLIIDYNTGSTESRPKKQGKAPTHKQIWLEKQ